MTPLDAVRQHVGRRSRITREEMATIIRALALPPEVSTIAGRDSDGRLYTGDEWIEPVHADDPTVPPSGRPINVALTHLREQEAIARAWARRCTDITVISIFGPREGRDGGIRFDAPGSMHPGQHADVAFVSASLGEHEYDQIGQMRRHAARLLIVRD